MTAAPRVMHRQAALVILLLAISPARGIGGEGNAGQVEPPLRAVPVNRPESPRVTVPDESSAEEPRQSAAEDERAPRQLSDQRAFLLLLLAAAGALLVYRAATARPVRPLGEAGSRAPRAASPAGGARFAESERIDWNRPVPTFLEDLRRRERTLDRPGAADPPFEEIIDVEFTEVRPEKDDT